jgi:hypothetical protein
MRKNYTGSFPNSEVVYADLGLGFSRENFSSLDKAKRTLRVLERTFTSSINDFR